MYLDAESPNSLCYIEEWSSPEDLARVVVTDHYTRLFMLMEEAERAPDLKVSTLLDVKGLDYLRALRSAQESEGAGWGMSEQD